MKAARALLDWSQEDLAETAKLCVATIRNLEKGSLSPRSANDVRKALENSGLEFYANNGLGYRKSSTQVFEGTDATDMFYVDLLETVKKSEGVVSVVCRSQELFLKSLGVTNSINHDRLKDICEFENIQCLLSEAQNASHFDESAQFRVLPKHYMGCSIYFAYGDRYAIALKEDGFAFRYVVFQSISSVRMFLNEFFPLWNSAVPLAIQTGSLQRYK